MISRIAFTLTIVAAAGGPLSAPLIHQGGGLVFGPSSAVAQEAPDDVEIPEVEPRPEDVETLDGIVAAFYDVISGPAGEPRQWGRDATLYLPGIRFTVVTVDPESGERTARTITKEEFIERSNDFLVESGFVEREIHRETRRFGAVAQVWSTYEWTTEDDQSGRGINGIHLFHDGARWWITHATWDSEREGQPIPEEFLPEGETEEADARGLKAEEGVVR